MSVTSTKTRKKLSERYLNLVFFIDTGKTRSWVFRLDRMIIVGVFVALISFWAIASFWFILSLKSQNKELSEKLRSSLNTVIDYQTRYDGIYEKAYSDALTKNAAEVAVVINNQKQEVAEAKAETNKKQAASAQEQVGSGDVLKVEKLQHNIRADGVLEFKFALKNLSKSEKLTGRFWGIAEYQSQDGTKVYIGQPSTIQVGPDGKIEKNSKGTSFSIKFYRERDFNFTPPKTAGGQFTSVTIYTSDEEGKILTFPFAVTPTAG